jgi:molybdenum cofactor cytidylyltransferase
VVPAAIEAAGGAVDHFGMPVDPGNLMLLGHHGPVPVVGLPGCARSPKLNGFDWVLQRFLAGLPVKPADVMGMGAGGLLKEISSRPQRREAAETASAPRAPRIDAIILAAGQSRRMGRINKLLAEIDGTPMVVRVVDAVRQSQARNIIVVTGHEAERVRAVLDGREVTFAENTAYADGLSASLTRGLGALAPDADGVLVVLGDMPAVRPSHLDHLIAAFNPIEGRAICVPTTAGKRGNPVLWGAAFFDEMAAVVGDVGARHLIGEHPDEVCEVAIDDDAIFLDIDTPDALTAFGRSGK